MNSRDRVLTAFAHQEPDRVPAWCGASEEFWAKAKRELDLDDEAREFLTGLADREGCSARAVGSVLAVAHTISALEGRESVKAPAIAEAFTYRSV